LSYNLQYIKCKVCGNNESKYLGIRGNLEYSGASKLDPDQEHIVTKVVRCARCGFVYVNPLILLDSQKGYNKPDEYSPSADNVDPIALFNVTMNLLEKYANYGKTLLDVGCGKGEFLTIAKDRGWKVFGIEPSKNLADYAVQKYKLDIKTTSIEKAGFNSSFFDAVTLNMVLEHIDEPNSVLREVNRVLKDKGILLIEVPNTDSLMLKLATAYFRLKRKNWSPLLSPLHHPFHSYGYNMSSLKWLLKNTGFEIKKFIITDVSLRGIRISPLTNNLEKELCIITSRIANFLGMGDVLTVVAAKN